MSAAASPPDHQATPEHRSATTPAVLCLLTIATGLPYFLITLFYLSQALAQPDAAEVTQPAAMELLRGLIAFICIVLTGQALWLWQQRHDPAPRDRSSFVIVLLSVVALVTIGIGTGSYNSPTVLTAILALVIGLALQPRRIVMYGFILSLVLLIGYQVLARAGLVGYKPLLVPGTFVHHTPVAWWSRLRDVLTYGGLLQAVAIMFWLFGRVDRQAARLAEMTRSDGLTGLADRAYFMTRLEEEVARRDREDTEFCLALCNIDWFRLINDSYGHVAGDAVLRRLGENLAEVCRPQDVAARLGGDEFAILFAGCSREQALLRCERLRMAMLSQEFRAGDKEFRRITMSIGLIECRADGPEALLNAAGANVRHAKAQGRNRIVATTLTGEAA